MDPGTAWVRYRMVDMVEDDAGVCAPERFNGAIALLLQGF